jgi:hypothetical protein
MELGGARLSGCGEGVRLATESQMTLVVGVPRIDRRIRIVAHACADADIRDG